MATNSLQMESVFSGHYDSSGGTQFVGNSFSTGGAPIYFDSSSDNKLPARICDLPESILSSYFTGRDSELQQIDHALSTSSDDSPGRCVIYGMPGVGKTQLALKFASLAFQKSQYAYVFWISAASVEKSTRDFAKLADLLRLPGRHTSDQAGKVTTVRAWLEDLDSARSWLVVFDNVTLETSVTLRDLLPRRNRGGKLLMTTRTQKIADVLVSVTFGATAQIALQTPGIHEAMAMLSAGTDMRQENVDEKSFMEAEQLIRAVGSLPLAIDQAASYLRDTGSGIDEILSILESEEAVEMLSWENDLSRHEEKSVAATFNPALNKIRDTAPDALILLRIICFCDPESIPMSIFVQGCEVLNEDDLQDETSLRLSDELKAVTGLFRSRMRLSKAIQDIQRLSLATCAIHDSDRVLRMHDLVHILLRSKLMAEIERVRWLEVATHVICVAFDEINDYEDPRNWDRCNQFVSHIETLENFAEQYGLRDGALLYASFWAAKYFVHCGLYEEAIYWHKRTWKRHRLILGESHLITIRCAQNLAKAYGKLGHYDEAEELERQALELRKTVQGEEDPETLAAMGDLASTYTDQGRWTEAQELQEFVISKGSKVLDEEDKLMLTLKGNLAMTYESQGKYREAEELLVPVVEISRKVLGEEHTDTLSSTSNLALIYGSQDRLEDAEELDHKVMTISSRIFGKDHPETLAVANNLAVVYKYQGRLKESAVMQRKILRSRTKVLGKDHPDTLNNIHVLASIMRDQGCFEEAEDLNLQCVKSRQAVLGAEHPDTLITMGNLVLVYLDQGRYEDAEELSLRVMKMRERTIGREHPDTLIGMSNLASIYISQKRWQEAADLQVQLLEIRSRVLGDEHSRTLNIMQGLALTLRKLGRDEEALAAIKRCYDIRMRVFGPDHPDLEDVANTLHDLEEKQWEDVEEEEEGEEEEEKEEEKEGQRDITHSDIAALTIDEQ